jgi:hypothetical protein
MSIYDKLNKTTQLRLINEVLDYYGINTRVRFVSQNLLESSQFRKKYKRNMRISNRGRISPSALSNSDQIIYAEYLFDTNEILLNSSATNNRRDFLLTLLHELKHAEQSNDLGKHEFQNKYHKHMESFNSEEAGYNSNPYEIEAEEWAKQELSKWL